MGAFRPTAPSVSPNETTNVIIKDSAGHELNILATGEADMNLKLVGGNAVNAGAGAVGTGTLRVVLATDDLVVTSTGTVGDPAPARRSVIGVKAETTFPTAVDDGDAVDILSDEYGRLHIKGYSPSANALMVTDIAPAVMQKFGPVTFTTLAAAGSTASSNISPYSTACWGIVVASLAAGETCVVRVEGSMDDSNWFNLDDDGVDITISANGTYQISKYGVCCKYIRFTLVTDSASGAVTIAPTLMAGLS